MNAEDKRTIAVITLALEADAEFDKANRARCTCGSDPEDSCDFCSSHARAQKKLDAFIALIARGLLDD